MKKLYCKNQDELLAVLSGLGPQAVHVTILHDDACSPSACVCSPDFVIEDLTGDVWFKAMKLQEEWIKNSSS